MNCQQYTKELEQDKMILTRRLWLWRFGATIGILGMLVLIMGCGMANAADRQYSDHDAILAIIGEAEDQGYDGMLAIACAIRNRGTMKGVYGLHARRVIDRIYNHTIYVRAFRAWNSSVSYDTTHGATGWGTDKDLVVFKKQGWFKDCVITAHILDHWFYKKV